MKKQILLTLLLGIFIIPIQSQDFGRWSYWDVLATNNPQTWPSIINPLPVQKGFKLDSVHIIRTSQGDTLLTVDRCNWQGSDVEICREYYYWNYQNYCDASYYFDSLKHEEIYLRGDYSSYLRKLFDQSSRDSIIEAIDQARNADEGLYSIRAFFYNSNDELSAEVVKTSNYLNFTNGYAVPENLDKDSITYSYQLNPSGNLNSSIELHNYTRGNDEEIVYEDSTLFYYTNDGKISTKLFVSGNNLLDTKTAFEYYSDSLTHITESVFSGDTAVTASQKIYYIDKGYNEAGEFTYQYDEQYFGDVTFVREYTMAYDSLGRLKEWTYNEGPDRIENRKIIFFWPTAASVETDPQTDIELTVFPNPFVGILNIEISETSYNRATIMVLDQTSRIVMHAPWPAGVKKYRMDLSHLAPGLYAIRVQDGEKYWIKKILKVR